MDRKEFFKKLIESYISYDTSALVADDNEMADEVSDNELEEQVDRSIVDKIDNIKLQYDI